jgi:hypothetical protein
MNEDFTMQRIRENASKILNRRRLLETLSAIGIGLFSSAGAGTSSARAQTPNARPAPAKIPVTPPPADVNDLSMEVNALRTMYILRPRGLSQPTEPKVTRWSKDCAQRPRKRTEAKVSKNYRQVLIELRAAFIVGQENRINELSDQLEELATDEQPQLDDAIEITDQARKSAHGLVNFFDPPQLAAYIAAYGKDFPEPYQFLAKIIGCHQIIVREVKPGAEEWKELRYFAIREVSWQIGGLNLNQQAKIGEQVAKLLDRAYPLSADELKKQYGSLRGEIGRINSQSGGTMNIINNVIEQDLAELVSNPRCLPAIAAREQYLKKAGITP